MNHKYEYAVKICIYGNAKLYAIYRKGHLIAVTSYVNKVAAYVRNQRIVNILFDIRRKAVIYKFNAKRQKGKHYENHSIQQAENSK